MNAIKISMAIVLLGATAFVASSGMMTLSSGEPVDNLRGKIVQITESTILVRDEQHQSHNYRMDETTHCVVNGREAPTSQLTVGLNCLLTSIDGRIASSITAFDNNVQQIKAVR